MRGRVHDVFVDISIYVEYFFFENIFLYDSQNTFVNPSVRIYKGWAWAVFHIQESLNSIK